MCVQHSLLISKKTYEEGYKWKVMFYGDVAWLAQQSDINGCQQWTLTMGVFQLPRLMDQIGSI